jgi:diaminopimelate decarboxylase
MRPTLHASDHSSIGPASQLLFSGKDLGQVARTLDTPLFLLSERILEGNHRAFLTGFAGIERFAAYYSVKTNFETEVLRTWRRLGMGAEISGELDFHVALQAGFEPGQIIFDGPCKTDAELASAVARGVHVINVESVDEIRRLEAVARRAGRTVDIGVRIDPMNRRPYYDKLITTYKQKFGFHITRCREAFAAIRECRSLRLMGLHAHIGSQILAPGLYVEALDTLFGLAAELRRDGFAIDEINIGGGFPAPSVRNLRLSRRMLGAKLLQRFNLLEKRTPSIEEFGQIISRCYLANAQRHGFAPRLTTEPGRCLVNNAAVLLGRVRLIKDNWVFTDLSVNDVPENLFFTEWRVFFPGKVQAPVVGKANLSGPTLSTYDVLFFEKEVPALAVGDPIAIFDTGGYSIPRANQFTKPRNPVYFLDARGDLRLIRRRETVADVVRTQIWDEDDVAVEAREPAESAALRA